MWPFTKRKSPADLAVEAMPRAIDIAAQKWVEFEAQPFATEMDLTEKLHLFTEGIARGFSHWKEFKDAPGGIFLLIAAKGVERSRTYLRLELEAALGIPIPAPFERSDEEELDVLNGKLIERAARKWSYFEKAMPFKAEVPLATRIRAFKMPFLEGVRNDYPMFKDAPDDEFDPMIALGIDQTGTHSIVEVQRALGLKY